MPFDLTESQRDFLATFNRMIGLIRDRVRTVALRHQTGAYIVGRSGSGKTYTVRDTLERLVAANRNVSFVIENARMSPAALFDLIEDRPDSVIVLDDVPLLFGNRQGMQILLAALGGDPGKPRRVTYSIKGQRRVVEFSGGIIAISNLPLSKDPMAQALASRVTLLEHEPTDEMLWDWIESQVSLGYKGLKWSSCQFVADFVYGVCRDSDYRLDLRYYYKGLEDYLFCRNEDADSEWMDLVRSSIKRIHLGEIDPASPTTRASRMAWEREIARDLFAREMGKAERDAEWKRLSGKAPDSLYRRKRELKV